MSATEHEYKRLIGKLGGNKSFLTKKANTVAAWCEVQDLEGEELIEASQLQVTIEERLVLLQGLFDEILGLPEVTDQDIEDFETYERDIRKKLAKLKHKLVLSQPVPISPADDPDRTIPVSPRSVDAQSTLEGAVKYPEIKLPTFSGGSSGTKNFTPFYQLFKALVEDKTDIPQIYKVQYLRECLPERSEARELIDYIPPVAENYDLIMSSLKSRYDDKTGEANKLRRSLRQIASWSVANSLESQRKLVDHVRQTISLLEQVDTITPDDMKGLSLDILSVLPERLKYKVCEWEQRERTVKAIITLLESSIKSKLEVRSLTDSSNKPESSRPRHTTPKTSNSYFTCHSSGNTSQDCLYCGGDHVPHTCTQMSLEERVDIVLEAKRCWNCLGPHQVRDCRLPSRCSCRKGKHSQSLCGAVPPWRGARKQGTAYVATESLVSPGVGTVSYLSSLVVDLPDKVGGTQKVRFLLDGCATHTYGLESCVSRLKTTDRGKKINMTVSSFNGPRQVSARLVELELPNCPPMNIIVTNYICEPLQGHNIDSSLRERLQQYPLADPACITEGSLPIDILVGVDNFWKLVTDQIIRLTSGLIVMSTKFGYCLSGEIAVPGRIATSGAYIAHTLVSPCVTVHDLKTLDTRYQYSQMICKTSLPPDSDMDEVMCQLEKDCDLDTLGIKPDREISPVLDIYQSTEMSSVLDVCQTLEISPVLDICQSLEISSVLDVHQTLEISPVLELSQPLGVDVAEKVLGIMWNQWSDTLGLNRTSTKRELLRATAQMLYSHGLYSLVVLVPDLLFHKLCSWWDQIPFFEGVRVQRQVSLPEDDCLELHGCSDASQSAYTATDGRKSSRGSESACHLIRSKGRVTPQKDFTITHLELLGAVLLVHLIFTLVALLKHLKFDDIVVYTDSMNSLHWICTEHLLWSVVVACQIREINSHSNFIDWNYVHGPDFLIERQTLSEVHSSHSPTASLQERTGVGTVFKWGDFSLIHGLLIRTVLYLRFVYCMVKEFSKDLGDRFDFSCPELHTPARLLWLKDVQVEHYSVEAKFCQSMSILVGMKVPLSFMKHLDLSLVQYGVWCVRTRLKHTSITETTDCHLTKLSVRVKLEFLPSLPVLDTMIEFPPVLDTMVEFSPVLDTMVEFPPVLDIMVVFSSHRQYVSGIVDKGEEPCVLRHKSPRHLVPLEAGDDSFW